MRTFDYSTWMDRAERRSSRLKAKGNRSAAIERHERDVCAIEGLSKVIEWCDKRPLKVTFGRVSGGGLYYSANSTIVISSYSSPESQLFLLLHEIGHFLVDKCGSSKAELLKRSCARESSRSFSNKVDVIDEEYVAWNRGANLATRLNVELDCERFNDYRVRSLRSYFYWAVDDKGYE